MLWWATVLATSGLAGLVSLLVFDFPTGAVPVVGGLAFVALGAAIALGAFRFAEKS